MGKKNKQASSLGRALIKDRFGKHDRRKFNEDSMLHTAEVQDGYDWGRLNLQSVTEESSFQEFLSTAELAGTEFQGEKLNITFVNPKNVVNLPTKDETLKMKQEHEAKKEFIKIPRRPKWDESTTKEELDNLERENFLEWRRGLANLQEEQGLLMTPFEKNLEFWRQLWRVVERSDVVIQIVDARNPLLFRCEDLEKYVKEVSENKINMILINKADFLTENQRKMWAEYFDSINVRVAFYSALKATEDLKKIDEEDERESETNEEKKVAETNEEEKVTEKNEETEINDEKIANILAKREEIKEEILELDEKVKKTAENLQIILSNVKLNQKINNSIELLGRDELITLFKIIHTGPKVTENITTIGLVGYPNVGKSSTINSLLTTKKVSVSATPGKTKHFQTLFLDKDLLLCDCPGLVMPSFVFTKAEMVISGILPIDQMKDHVSPVNLVTSLIPKHVIEDKYGLMLPAPDDGEDPLRPPTSEELLNAYGYTRGFMTVNGQPDNPRSARYILKDFVNGKLLYCYAPPGIEQEIFHVFPEKIRASRQLAPQEVRAIKTSKISGNDLDKQFFEKNAGGVHIKGRTSIIPSNSNDNQTMEKPWKQQNKHKNKNKREKLRRVYSHLDEH